MHTWFETVIGYEKTAEEGKIVKVKEHYLIDALSHAEAENRIIEEMNGRNAVLAESGHQIVSA